jgi:hypothetical protein
VDVLRRHVALCQQEDALALIVLRHVHHHDRMAGKTALDEDIAGLDLRDVLDRGQLPLQRPGAGIDEDEIEILAKIRPRAVSKPGSPPLDAFSADVRALARLPGDPRQASAIGRTKADLGLAAGREEVLGAQPHHRVSALLMVTHTNVNVQDGLVRGLVPLLAAIKQTYERAVGPNWKTP